MEDLIQFLFYDEWPWWFTGPIIGLFVGFYVWSQNRSFGMSGNFASLLDVLTWRRHTVGAEQQSVEESAAMLEGLIEKHGGDVDAAIEEMQQLQAGPASLSQVAHNNTRAFLIIGVVAGALLEGFIGRQGAFSLSMGAVFDETFGFGLAAQATLLAFGGILVGFGARLAGGCPSGHGLSGLSTLSPGSLIAVPSFMATGVVLTYILELL